MGCTESLPADSEYAVRHDNIGRSFPPLHKSSWPDANQAQQLVVKGMYDVSLGCHSVRLEMPNGKLFGRSLVLMKTSDRQVILRDSSGTLIAVCRRKRDPAGETFKIYSANPFRKDQKESKNRDVEGSALYSYAIVQRFRFRSSIEVKYANEWGPSFTVNRAGERYPVQRTVRSMRNSLQMAAFLEESPPSGAEDGSQSAFTLHVNPGIDPYLMTCVAAVCGQLD